MHVIRGGLHYNMELRWEGVPSLFYCSRNAQRTGKAYTCSSVGKSSWRLV
ncbi:hypothetical protein ACT7DZ_10940 [Bacillus cereus]